MTIRTPDPTVDETRRAEAPAARPTRREALDDRVEEVQDRVDDRLGRTQGSGGFAAFAAAVATGAGRPASFVSAVTVVLVWAISGPMFQWSETWQLVINTGTTIVTFLMVFVIQNAQNRDGMAIQVKLDELIRVTRAARNDFVGIEDLDDRQVEALKREMQRYAAAGGEWSPVESERP